jgi:hypothetical protein
MLLVFLAWLSLLLLFGAVLHALHTIAIYTDGPLQRNLQQVQLRRLRILSSVLCLCACFLLAAHFTLADDPRVEGAWPAISVPSNVST